MSLHNKNHTVKLGRRTLRMTATWGGIKSLCVPVVLLLGGPCGVLEISFQVLDGVVHLLEDLFDVLHRDPGGGVEVEDLLFEGEELRKVPLHVLNQEVKQSPGILAVLGVVELGQVTDVAKTG